MSYPVSLYLGDCGEELKQVGSESVDLIFTSPPYADSRKNTYGGVPPEKYKERLQEMQPELLLTD